MYTFFEQVRMIVQFILLGMFMSIMIDVADLFRTKNKVLSSIVQLLFWFLISVVVCKVVLVISKGFLPLYTFAFFLVGYLIYRFFLRKRFVSVLDRGRRKVRSSKKRLLAIVLPVELSRKCLSWIARLLKKMKPKRKRKETETSTDDEELVNPTSVTPVV